MGDRVPGEAAPRLKEYLELQDSLKGRRPGPEEYLSLHSKAEEAGLPREARDHLEQAGRLYPAHPRVREQLESALGPEEFSRWAAAQAGEKPFWRDLGEIVRYPSAPGALAMIATAAAGLSLGRAFEDLMTLLPWLKIVSVPAFMISGLAWFTMVMILPGFCRTIAWRTALGEKDFPSWPGLADLWGQMVLPTLKAALILLWSFLPVTLIATAAARASQPPSLPLLLASLAFGCLYFPMAFLMFAVSDKLWPSLLPSNVVEAIAKTFSNYLKLVFLFWLIVLPGLLAVLMWPVPFLGVLVPAFLNLYSWAAAMRLLGRFYRLEAARLEWV